MHLSVNLQSESGGVPNGGTENFIQRHQLELVGDDFNALGQHQVKRLFFNFNSQPLFVLINGVTDSSTHGAWALMDKQDGYGNRDFEDQMTDWRGLIDAVRPAPMRPVLGVPQRQEDGSVQFSVNGEAGASYLIQVTGDFSGWQEVGRVTLAGSSIQFTDETAVDRTQGFYRAVLLD